MKIERPRRHNARIEMIPLIDVIFLLLVTFILFSMTMTVHKGLRLELPGAATATVEQDAIITISVRSDGAVFLEGEKVEKSDLSSLVAALHRLSPERRVLVSGDRQSSYESIVFVMDAVRSAGFEGVSLETVDLVPGES